MKSNVWLRLVWNDYQLQWDESEYGGIGVLRLPPDKVISLKKKKKFRTFTHYVKYLTPSYVIFFFNRYGNPILFFSTSK